MQLKVELQEKTQSLLETQEKILRMTEEIKMKDAELKFDVDAKINSLLSDKTKVANTTWRYMKKWATMPDYDQ